MGWPWTAPTSTGRTSCTGRIGRATLDGTNVNLNFIPQAGLPAAVAVNDRFIYWTNQIIPQAIGARASTATEQRQPELHSVPSTNIEGIAVDDKHIYWTQRGEPATTPAAIGRANLGGKAVDPNFITGSGRDGPYNGVAVDSKYVYWSNGSEISGPRCDQPREPGRQWGRVGLHHPAP